MKSIVGCLALAALMGSFIPAQAAPGARTVRLFILTGQSNAGGKGVGSELPAEYRNLGPDVLAFGKGFKELAPLRPYPRKGFGTDNTAFGAEITFAYFAKKAFPDDIICIAKQTEGACSIVAWDKHWQRPEWKSDLARVKNENKEPQYPDLMRVIQDAQAALKAHPGAGTVELAGVLWVQSERDDNHPGTAADYEKNLRALIANLRADTKVADLPFLFADANGRQNLEVLRAGMRRVAAEVPNTALVSIEGLPRGDNVHYNAAGQVELGRRFSEAYLKMVGRPLKP
ncbi:MAG TPA: sialate O-acetylesterase [Kiritimatiellia bacterium]|nr:sialate O-acetylesterase [Kiritimatiellia bacterium]